MRPDPPCGVIGGAERNWQEYFADPGICARHQAQLQPCASAGESSGSTELVPQSTDAVSGTLQQVGASAVEVKLLVLAAVIMEFYCNLKRIEILHEKLAGLGELLFPWALQTHNGTTPLLTATIAGVESFWPR